MSTDPAIEARIDSAAESVGSVWPIHSFVTANPLAGFEDRPFHEAVADAERLTGGDGYPSVDVFRRAWESGRIDDDRLRTRLSDHGYDADPEASLARMAAAKSGDSATSGRAVGSAGSAGSDPGATGTDPKSTGADPESTGTDSTATTATDRVDAVLTKWLAAFLDEGRAEWPMPNREAGFYEAFRTVARYDDEVPNGEVIAELPDRPTDAISDELAAVPVGRWEAALEFHLAALPGWTGLIKRRAADGGAWQSTHPITLSGYLAVRLALVDLFDAPLAPPEERSGAGVGTDVDTDANDELDADANDEPVPLAEVWLTAWEATYRSELVDSVSAAGESLSGTRDDARPEAQLVFCIDTRSEIIRRHIEAAGEYETHGYAGFFGVPMRYAGYDSDVTVDACPPIVDPRHRIADRPRESREETRNEYDRWRDAIGAGTTALKRLQSNVATAFSFVESAGAGYGAAIAARTLLPARVHRLLDAVEDRVPSNHEVCTPAIDHDCAGSHGGPAVAHGGPDATRDLPAGLTHDEKVEYAATAFELMGWERFARLVVVTGHASQTANNPFDSSLDCGACAGNPGGPSARVLAAICNDESVKADLRDRGIDVPEDTVFVAGEHNTTTDEVELYAGDVPESHEADVERLRADLETARAGAAAERVADMGAEPDSTVNETERRAADWAETRPEWGLAGNAGFVVGPRDLTDGLDLDGRSFLHSYDWETDPDGDALEAILTGPMVVTQWINAQYYFATVDNAVYGSGSKVTQNPVGNVGVYQGNGGDLMTGLPLQSLMSTDDDPYHQPLRLSTVVHAPVDRVAAVLAEHEAVAELLDNDWLALTVVDPQRNHQPFHYAGDGNWTPEPDATTPEPEPAPEPTIAHD